MSAIPSNISRVPNLLRTSLTTSTIARTSIDMLRVQQQITSGVEISRPSDNIVRAALISALDERLDRGAQLARNFSHADAALGVLDSILGEAHGLGLNAKSIASEQMSTSTSPQERAAQAGIIDQLIQSLYTTANRQSVVGYALGGTRPGAAPVVEHLGGYRFVGGLGGLITDLGLPSGLPLTLGGNNPLTGQTARVRGSVDLNPDLTPDTRLADLGGARGLGVTPGAMRLSINGGTPIEIDLAGSDSIRDIAARLTGALRDAETDLGFPILGTGGVGVSDGALAIALEAGVTLEFSDIGTATTARDLGLAGEPAFTFSDTTPNGLDLNPRLTWRTPVSALAGLAAPLGQVSIRNAGRTSIVDLSTAQTLGDVRNMLEGAGLGVRVVINSDGSGIDVLNETSAGSHGALSISDVAGQGAAASALGIRTLMPSTRLADFNFGRGVSIVDGRIDPDTNTPTRALNTDIRIILGNSGASPIDIDLRPQDMATVDTLLARMNSEIEDELARQGLPTGSLVAELDEGSNAIVLRQSGTFPDPLRVEARNNSSAAEQLGLLGGTYDAGSARLIGQDRAGVRVPGLFSDLLDLREALLTNDTRGIALAGVFLDESIDGLADVRGAVGGHAQRVEAARVREADRAITDESIRSELRDTDFAKAASRLSLLQTQLQAALTVAGSAQRLSLLDFLG